MDKLNTLCATERSKRDLRTKRKLEKLQLLEFVTMSTNIQAAFTELVYLIFAAWLGQLFQ